MKTAIGLEPRRAAAPVFSVGGGPTGVEDEGDLVVEGVPVETVELAPWLGVMLAEAEVERVVMTEALVAVE